MLGELYAGHITVTTDCQINATPCLWVHCRQRAGSIDQIHPLCGEKTIQMTLRYVSWFLVHKSMLEVARVLQWWWCVQIWRSGPDLDSPLWPVSVFPVSSVLRVVRKYWSTTCDKKCTYTSTCVLQHGTPVLCTATPSNSSTLRVEQYGIVVLYPFMWYSTPSTRYYWWYKYM